MPRVRKRETFSKQKSIAIQTDSTDSNIEISRLQEQLKLLQLENDTLKKHVNGNIVSKNDLFDKSKLESVQSPRRVNKIPKGNSQVLKSATKTKLCTCKGNCSSKICGCVKGERKCGPTCKCDAQVCQNQELENKENMGDPQNETVHETQKSENMPLKDKTEYQSLFSPEGVENEAQLSNIQLEDICFDTQRELTYTSDEESQSKNKSNVRNGVFKRRNKDKKEYKNISDKGHTAVSRKNIKTKVQNHTNEINENNVKKLDETKSEIQQVSPLSKEDDKMSTPEADTSFDPMKPKRQLLRTPPHGNSECAPGNVSTIVKTPTEEIEQKVDIVPDELNQENVDLSKLQIELVGCERCKRKFYPWRIAVHKSACIGV